MWIADWVWGDANVDHIARHGITVRQVLAVARRDPRFRRNRKGRAATHQMIGPDAGGAFVAVFLAPAGSPRTRRAITARYATETERQWWERT